MKETQSQTKVKSGLVSVNRVVAKDKIENYCNVLYSFYGICK